MSDTVILSPVPDSYLLYEQQLAARTRLVQELRPANKAAVFDPLAAAGITSVVVTFDGVGDSGQIESIDARVGDAGADLPAGEVELATPTADGSGVDRAPSSLRDAIELLAYDCLEETHGGWENEEGAYGQFTFDVADRLITLSYNERVLESVHSGHEF